MSQIVAKRELLHAANNLVKTNRPDLSDYEALLSSIATLFKYDLGDVAVDYKCVLMQERAK